MAKERLSRLQKWILVEADKRDWHYFRRSHIFKDFFKFELLSKRTLFKLASESLEDYRQERNRLSVVLSRSIKRVKEKGLIEDRRYIKVGNIDLTPKGREMVRLLK